MSVAALGLVGLDESPGIWCGADSNRLSTPEQCRAARGLLDWTQPDLVERAGVRRSTVRSFENGQHELHRGSAAVIRTTLEAAGIVLIDPDEQRPGAGLRKPTGR